MIFNLLHLIVSWGLLHHLSLQDLHLPAWLMSTNPKEKKSCVSKRAVWTLSTLTRQLIWNTAKNIKIFFLPLCACGSRRSRHWTVGKLRTQWTVSSIYSCPPLQPDVSCVFAHGKFCLSTGCGWKYPGVCIPAVPGHPWHAKPWSPGSPASLQPMGPSHFYFLSLKGEIISQI